MSPVECCRGWFGVAVPADDEVESALCASIILSLLVVFVRDAMAEAGDFIEDDPAGSLSCAKREAVFTAPLPSVRVLLTAAPAALTGVAGVVGNRPRIPS